MRAAIRAWWERHILGPIDPDPEYSRLDKLDGLGE